MSMTNEEIDKLTDTEINQAIAEHCGWTDVKWIHRSMETVLTGDRPGSLHHSVVPDYCRDLNAMHEAEDSLSIEQKYFYGDLLAQIIQQPEIEIEKKYKARRQSNNALFMPNGHGWFAAFHATATQRATAFLLTV